MNVDDRLNDFKARMAVSDIKQIDLAMEMSCSQVQISNWMNGRVQMPDDQYDRMDRAIERLERAEQAAREARERVMREED